MELSKPTVETALVPCASLLVAKALRSPFDISPMQAQPHPECGLHGPVWSVLAVRYDKRIPAHRDRGSVF